MLTAQVAISFLAFFLIFSSSNNEHTESEGTDLSICKVRDFLQHSSNSGLMPFVTP